MTGESNGQPLIGVTSSELRRAETVQRTPQAEPPRLEIALGLVYMQALDAAGGVPLVVPPLEFDAIDPLLDRLDGLCLSGGPDLHPSLYGAEPHPQLGPTEPDLDRFEQEVIRRADARGMPILAICRGLQALNVARGGTLVQHLPDVTDLPHRRREPDGDHPSHPIEIEPDSLLAAILGATGIDVNTYHHQAIERLGGGLRVTARAPDGVIEAIEDPGRPFCLGVQWHAEVAGRGPEAALFRRFVAAAAGAGGGAPVAAAPPAGRS